MREALAVVAEEGLEAMWARHEAAHRQLWAGLGALGLQPFVEDPKDRLATVNTIKASWQYDQPGSYCYVCMPRPLTPRPPRADRVRHAHVPAHLLRDTSARPACRPRSMQVPPGVDWAALCQHAMDVYSVEVSGGLGPTSGRVWRVGLMGSNARPANVELVLAAFRSGLALQGYRGGAAAAE
jgi:alanine-glyoxylate transaminase/serine-glyoxylate transaminase/serine-pyruvate transaminase